jgi:hypothetical protein
MKLHQEQNIYNTGSGSHERIVKLAKIENLKIFG